MSRLTRLERLEAMQRILEQELPPEVFRRLNAQFAELWRTQ